MQFEKQSIRCLNTVKQETQTQEQTQEFRISDGMPDIGTVVGAWGQVILRSKEWQPGTMAVSGGTMVWVQYLPEDGGIPQCVETWIPFQMTWPLPQTQRDGVIHVQCMLRSADARSTSARKMMIRTNVSVNALAMEERELEIHMPQNIPNDIELRQETYPAELPVCAGEKAFTVEETLYFPPSIPKPEKLISYQLQPEIHETKIVNGKLVFRGNGILHILYLAEDNGEYTWDFDLPFAQYCELETDCEDGNIFIIPCVTALEIDREDDRQQVKAGVVCQYRISNQTMIKVITDAYSPHREISMVNQDLLLPGILENKAQMVSAQQSVALDAMRLVDVQFQPETVTVQSHTEEAQLEIPGRFQLLYYDMDGELRCTFQKWEQNHSVPTGPDVHLNVMSFPNGKVQSTLMPGNCQVSTELKLITESVNTNPISMVTGLEVGTLQEPDPDRPSVILRRAGEESLWELAKSYGSTVAAIQEANGQQTEPGQMLLIPLV